MIEPIRLVEYGRDLSSCAVMNDARKRIEAIVADGNTVLIDFTGVRTFTEGAANNLLATLVVNHGAEWFKDKLTLVGHGDHMSTIMSAVQQRLLRQPKT